MKRLLLLLMLSVCLNGAKADMISQYNMITLNLSLGLSSNFVDDIFQDSNGFMWFSTHNGGLVRYDGYSFMPLGFSTGIRLRSNASRNVCEDKHQRLWAAFDEGFEVIDLNRLQVVTPHCADEKLAATYRKLYRESCIRTYCDTKGNVWLVLKNRLCRLSFDEDGAIAAIAQLPYSAPPSFPDVAISDVRGDGSVVMAYRGRLCVISGSKTLSAKPLPGTPADIRGRVVTSILSYHGAIWLATTTGLFNTRAKDNVYRVAPDGSGLQHDYVSSLAVAPDGRLLIGTLRGVDILDDRTHRMEHWNRESLVNPLSSNFVNCLYVRDGRIWVGTETNGVVKLAPRQLDVVNYVHHEGENSISPNAVNAMYAQPDGTLWVGTVEGGLNRLDQSTGLFTHYTAANSALTHNSVSALEPDASGHLWIGTWGGGLAFVDMNHPADLQHFEPDAAHLSQLTFIGALAYDSINHGLWIGANEGVFYYNMYTRAIEEPFAGCTGLKGNIGSIITRDGTLFMGNLSGMVEVNLHSRPTGRGTFAYKVHRYKLDNPQSGVFDKLTAFCQTADGTLWIGSTSYGLYHATKQKQGGYSYKSYTKRDGLASDFVKGIVEDRYGMLWITTDNGLSLFNPQTGVFNNFSEADGLVSSQFYFNGAIRSAAGPLYFGTDKGLVALNGVTSFYRDTKRNGSALKFTRLMVDNQYVFAGSRYLNQDISKARKVTLHESDRSFAIEFSALNYGNETQGVYSYRMKGFDKEWTQLQPGQHSVRYSVLPSGSYQFEVRYLPSVGAKDGETISIDVSVTPYFYKSWWFLTLLLIAVIAVARFLYLRRLKIMREREAERLYAPIAAALKESDEPGKLQTRIQNILKTQKRYQESQDLTVQADKEEAQRTLRPFMERVLKIMQENYGDADFGVMELAAAVGMNRSALSKRLNEETGVSTQQFIRNYRLEVAKKMLDDNVSNRNVTEIAYRVGFNDPKYFTRCFSRLFGVSPSAYKSSQE